MIFSNQTLCYIDWALLLIMSICMSQQMFSSRFNLYGVISIISLTTYISLHTIQSGINAFVLILFLGALLLIVAEFFIPGGIMGIVGTITLIYSIIVINKETHQISFIILVSFILFVIWYLINIYVFKNKLLLLNRFVLDEKISTEKGYVAKESNIELLGKNLIAFTDLRPSGIAIFENEKYDVVTEGEFVEKGNSILVTQVEGMRIVVRKI